MATQEERFQNVIIKLGLRDAGDKAIFRRLTYRQLTNNNKSADESSVAVSNNHSQPVKVLKKHAVRLTLPEQTAMESIRVSDYAVQLVYTDQDGDKVMIAVTDDLVAALNEAVESGKLKILATVQPKLAAAVAALPRTACAETQTAKSPVQLQAVVESIVSLLATAAVAVQNQVKSAAAEITEVQNEAARAKRPSLTAPPAAAETPAPEAATQTAAPTPESTTTLEEPLFIHGRHTCDGCLTTPIVGKRFHAINLPDYDLCETCKNNYAGSQIQFEEAVLDRDRPFQERWSRRHAKFTSNNNGRGRRGRPMRAGPRGGRPRCWGPPPHHFGPPPPPPHHFGPPPPPPHHFGPPPQGPFDPFAPPPPLHMFGGPQEENQPDLALAEALRRSLEVEQEEDAAVEFPLEEPPTVLESDMVKESKPAPSAPVEEEDIPVDAKPAASPTPSTFEDDAAILESEAATALGQTFDRVAQVIDGMHSELERSHVVSDVDDDDMSDDMTDDDDILEDDDDEDEDEDDEDEDDEDVGATIVDGDEEEEEASVESQNSWDLVGTDETLARAAQSLGSALFHSDMKSSTEIASTLTNPSGVSSVASVPTTVPSIAAPRWSAQLEQLHSMGFENDTLLVEILDSLEAANIGVDSDDEVTVQQVLSVLMKED